MMKKVLIINEDEEEATQFKIRKTIMHQLCKIVFKNDLPLGFMIEEFIKNRLSREKTGSSPPKKKRL